MVPATDSDSVPGSLYEVQANELSFVGAGSHHKTSSNFASSCFEITRSYYPLP